MAAKTPLWEPSQDKIDRSNMVRFMKFINERYGQQLTTYDELYDWSIEHIADLWEAWVEFGEIKLSKPATQVIDDPTKMPGAKWFPGAELNFAENLLRFRDDRTALIFHGEEKRNERVTYAELYDRVARMARSLKDAGVVKGDRVVGFMPNMIETVVAMLAATSMGATWSSCSPDFGIKGVLDRFGQIEPKVIFVADGYFYNGKTFDSLERVAGILQDLPAIEKVVVTTYVSDGKPDISGVPNAVHWDEFISDEQGLEIEFEQVPFDHPLYIMYSSGTTGLPKCMVQSVGGILLNQTKEMVLHTDMTRDDTIFYFTTCGWMMWNWLVSALQVGATLVLFDGSPFHPEPGYLWRVAQDEGITVFGTSAKYLAALEAAGSKPGKEFDLGPLRAVLSTGSPLAPESFEFVYRDIKQDLQLASISGGTDLNGCFALGNPTGPVYIEELQCRGLGMKVHAYDGAGKPVVGEQGELVCETPFPSMPIYFWKDPDGEKYMNAYFRTYPGVWCHGDFIEVTERGGLIMYGRSDATLNPQGVRIGTADIYSVVEKLDEVDDSVVVGQDWDNDQRVILFVVLAEGVELDEALEKKIKSAIRTETSPRHVPAKILTIGDIPYTINMKKVELAVRNVIHGRPVTNKDALRNPEALELYRDLPALKE